MKVLAVLLAATVLEVAFQQEKMLINFDNVSIGSAPSGWTATLTGSGNAKWTVEKDDTAPSKPNVLKQSGVATFPICFKNDTNLKDGFVEVKFKPISGKEDQAGGLIWRLKDANNYYVARANALEDNVTIYHTINGKRTEKKHTGTKVAPNVWHSLRVDFQGNHFVVTYDGKKAIEWDDDTFKDAGRVGVWTKADSVTRVRRFHVWLKLTSSLATTPAGPERSSDGMRNPLQRSLACYSGSMSILKFLGMNVDHPSHGIPTAETETVRKIVQKLDQLPEQQARYIAAFAFLLSRAARADLQIDADETAVMERIVMEQGGIPEELAVVVVQMAKTQNQLFGSTENYLVTREFERIATREQKLALLDCLFAVTAADENITAEEDNVVKQISSELKLSHDDYIAVRSRFREYLAVLKRGRHNE